MSLITLYSTDRDLKLRLRPKPVMMTYEDLKLGLRLKPLIMTDEIRYGIHHVDFDDPERKRTPKASFAVMEEIFRTKTIPEQYFR